METTEDTIRPDSWDTFLGQDELKFRLAIMIAGAKERNQQLGHILLAGPPGLGKTTLANIIASELGQEMVQLTGGNIKDKKSMLEIFMHLYNKGNCVLFVDEIHAMSRKISEVFYTALEDFYVDVDLGEGETARVNLPKFTLIGATTHPGMLQKPLKDRMEFQGELSYYDDGALTHVVQTAASKLGVSFTPEAARAMAKRGRGTPRVVINLVKNVRDYAAYKKIHGNIDVKTVEEGLKIFGIDSIGLNKLERRYLEYLNEEGKQGIKSLSDALGVTESTLIDDVEPYLLRARLIRREAKGRCLTQRGKDYLNKEEA